MASSKNFEIRKREVIGFLKSIVEIVCPESVSRADLIVLAAREAVALSGGPWISVPLGREDSPLTASYELADALLPSPAIGVDGMLKLFGRIGLTVEESVAIMGPTRWGDSLCEHPDPRNRVRVDLPAAGRLVVVVVAVEFELRAERSYGRGHYGRVQSCHSLLLRNIDLTFNLIIFNNFNR
ncbi:unnamed protein product [Linum trigynum]|uniref:peroxidase n=1 Tax=Linum trigynum TaxID=586398 RepID=A0AAV2FI09_9ROSI